MPPAQAVGPYASLLSVTGQLAQAPSTASCNYVLAGSSVSKGFGSRDLVRPSLSPSKWPSLF